MHKLKGVVAYNNGPNLIVKIRLLTPDGIDYVFYPHLKYPITHGAVLKSICDELHIKPENIYIPEYINHTFPIKR